MSQSGVTCLPMNRYFTAKIQQSKHHHHLIVIQPIIAMVWLKNCSLGVKQQSKYLTHSLKDIYRTQNYLD